MKALFVNPMVALNPWGSYNGTQDRQRCSLNHGLLSIATVAKEAGHEVAVLDLRQCADMDDAIERTRAFSPEVVGVSSMSVDFGVTLEYLRLVKERVGVGTKTVVGGVHPTIRREDADPACIDYVVIGEGELALRDAIDAGFRGCSRFIEGQRPDLDELPFIDRSLVEYCELDAPYWKGKSPYVTMMAGRGCPYKCAFCFPVSPAVFGRPRQRNPHNVINEMQETALLYGAVYYDFIDDTFTINKKWVREFCEAYRASGLCAPFVVASRADIISANPAMFAGLRRAGCDAVSVGFESGSDNVLRILNKGTTRAQNLEAARVLRELGFSIIANIIYGTPGESVEDAKLTTSMLEEIRPDVYSPAFFTPYPGCAMYESCGDLLLSNDWKDMHRYRTVRKMRGVDYEGISKVMYGAQEGG